MGLLEQASLVITPNAVKTGKLYSVIPNDGTGDLDIVRATSATRVNSSGLIESVSANIARLDYSNGSCPSILVEPQSTNLLVRSEEFDNASWIKTNATITSNSIISPMGNLTADKLMEVNGGNIPRLIYIFNATVGQSYTLSFYLKSAERNQVRVVFEGDGNKSAFFNSNTGVVSGIGYNTMSSMILLNNGWYRCSITISAGSSSSSFYIATAENNASILSGDNTKGIYFWGAQLEVGSNVTSYIPTTTATVTRNADVISKTNVLNCSNDFTFYFEDYAYLNQTGQYFSFSTPFSAYLSRYAVAQQTLRFRYNSTNYVFSAPLGLFKFIIKKDNVSMKLFFNGTLTHTITTLPTGLSTFSLIESSCIKSMFFNSALTDEQAIQLTTL